MLINLAEIETRIELIDWRDSAMASVTEQLENAFPTLIAAIEDRVRDLTTFQVAKAHADPRSLTQEMLRTWADEQSQIAFARAETELDALISNLKSEGNLGAVATALPAVAGVGMLAASVLALPALVTYATVTTTSFLVFSTSAVSIPVLLVGGTGLALLSLTGSKIVADTAAKARAHLASRVEAYARSAVFGTGAAPDARYLLNDLQAAILKAGQTQLAESA